MDTNEKGIIRGQTNAIEGTDYTNMEAQQIGPTYTKAGGTYKLRTQILGNREHRICDTNRWKTEVPNLPLTTYTEIEPLNLMLVPRATRAARRCLHRTIDRKPRFMKNQENQFGQVNWTKILKRHRGAAIIEKEALTLKKWWSRVLVHDDWNTVKTCKCCGEDIAAQGGMHAHVMETCPKFAAVIWQTTQQWLAEQGIVIQWTTELRRLGQETGSTRNPGTDTLIATVHATTARWIWANWIMHQHEDKFKDIESMCKETTRKIKSEATTNIRGHWIRWRADKIKKATGKQRSTDHEKLEQSFKRKYGNNILFRPGQYHTGKIIHIQVDNSSTDTSNNSQPYTDNTVQRHIQPAMRYMGSQMYQAV